MSNDTSSSSPVAKRPKLQEEEVDAIGENVISPSCLKEVETLRDQYKEGKPFPHGMIDGLCADGFLEKVLEELKQNTKVKFKESDLFRVFQSIDLGNLTVDSPLAEQMPTLMKLKTTLYSKEFRNFIEKISFLEEGTLTDQVDCAANCHTQGCHLLCHDDVIGNRKISYIIYLTDPDWRKEDGGALELYESEEESKTNGNLERKIPKSSPEKSILPLFNRLAYFAVEPGVSFHSVQEVFCDRPRLSIQGWYHAKEAPAQAENATLNRLKSSSKGEDTDGDFIPITRTINDAAKENDNELTKMEMDALSQYINPTYLKTEAIAEIRERFEEESSVQLCHFLNDSCMKKIQDAALKRDATDNFGNGRPTLDYTIGASEKWPVLGPAHKQRFLEYVASAAADEEDPELCDSDPGPALQLLKSELFTSPSSPFAKFLKLVTGTSIPTAYRGRVRRFRPGSDYTVAHYGILTTESVLDATLCFAAGKGGAVDEQEEPNDNDALWETGDAGGFECYISADDDDDNDNKKEADDEYDSETDTELLSVQVSNNTLSLVYRDPGTMRFVKYVGSAAPSSRWDLSLEYKVDVDEDE